MGTIILFFWFIIATKFSTISTNRSSALQKIYKYIKGMRQLSAEIYMHKSMSLAHSPLGFFLYNFFPWIPLLYMYIKPYIALWPARSRCIAPLSSYITSDTIGDDQHVHVRSITQNNYGYHSWHIFSNVVMISVMYSIEH